MGKSKVLKREIVTDPCGRAGWVIKSTFEKDGELRFGFGMDEKNKPFKEKDSAQKALTEISKMDERNGMRSPSHEDMRKLRKKFP